MLELPPPSGELQLALGALQPPDFCNPRRIVSIPQKGEASTRELEGAGGGWRFLARVGALRVRVGAWRAPVGGLWLRGDRLLGPS